MTTVDRIMELAGEYALATDYYSDIPSEPARKALRAAIVEALADAERYRSVVVRCARIMRGEGVEDQGEAWDLCLRNLDAAVQEQTPCTPHDDEETDDDYDNTPDFVCERCHGDGRDPWNDYLLPCPVCQGEQTP